MSTVDVVIVVHNHAATLAATLEGLAAQTLSPARVVVIDNASDDGSRAFLAGRQELEVISWDHNRGFAAGVNAGIRLGASPLVLSLNPDCRLSPDFLAALVTAAERQPRTGSACGLLIRAKGDALEPTSIVDSAGMLASASGRHHDRGAGRALWPALEQPAWVFGATGACALLRRTALADVAYADGEVFDEGFFAYREDADLAWRLQRRGWQCLYWPQARAFHARGQRPEAGRRRLAASNHHSVRNRFLLLWSNADWRWRLACFPWWAVRDAVVVGACATVERRSWKGIVEAWQRRAFQRQRGAGNTRRASVTGWQVASWCLPWRRVRKLER